MFFTYTGSRYNVQVEVNTTRHARYNERSKVKHIACLINVQYYTWWHSNETIMDGVDITCAVRIKYQTFNAVPRARMYY